MNREFKDFHLKSSQLIKMANMTYLSKKIFSRVVRSLLLVSVICSAGIFAAEPTQSDPSRSQLNTSNLAIAKNEIDRVIAIVNREVITSKDLRDRSELIKKQIIEAQRPLPTEDELIRQVLEKLIEESIIFQEASYSNFKISELEFESIVNNVISQRKMTPVEFRASLEKIGQSYDRFKESLRRDILLTRYRDRLIESRVKISDAELNNYISARLPKMSNATGNTATEPQTLYITQILIPTKDNDTQQEQNAAKAKAEDIFLKAKAEKDFLPFVNQLAQKDKTVKVQDLGYRTLDRLPQVFIDATATLQAGQFATTILKTSAGFHIVKLLDRKGGAPAPTPSEPQTTLGQAIQIDQAEIRHLMLTKKPGMNDNDLLRKIKTFKEQVDSKSVDFGELAKKFSEDKETASNGGYIGWVNPGQTLSEFDTAIKNTQAGNVTDPFPTEFGWHLLQVVTKDKKEITFAQQKDYARNALRQEKLEQVYQDWIRELRDNATVEYRAPFAREK